MQPPDVDWIDRDETFALDAVVTEGSGIDAELPSLCSLAAPAGSAGMYRVEELIHAEETWSLGGFSGDGWVVWVRVVADGPVRGADDTWLRLPSSPGRADGQAAATAALRRDDTYVMLLSRPLDAYAGFPRTDAQRVFRVGDDALEQVLNDGSGYTFPTLPDTFIHLAMDVSAAFEPYVDDDPSDGWSVDLAEVCPEGTLELVAELR